ncbi:QRFP-like peptide receptor [Dreissena polymorpha]|uniref:QRFP-like peptide receptor n=1 Tax=Dreissena polymorpha TaxID=45954 RepID=UPI0022652C4C|nr:QRFP-like peptide receptor [Dreissena polymorpha]
MNRTNQTTNSSFNNTVDAPFDIDVCSYYIMFHSDLTQTPANGIILIILYIMVAVLALLGNLLVIWTVWINSHMHTVTNYYIVNLAVSDLLVAAIVMPLKLLEYTAPCRWHIFRSDGLCSVVYYLLPVFVFASVLTLAAISIERYYAIVHPLSAMKVNSKSRTKKILAVTWILPFIVAGPFMFSTSYPFTIYSDTGSISRETCNDRFDEIDLAIHGDTTRIGEFRKFYFLFLFFAIYIVPSAVIMITCVKIAVSLVNPIMGDDSFDIRKDANRRQEENKRKVARMVIVIALTFIVSWTPFYLVSVISQLQTHSFLRESNFIFTMLVTHFCGFTNSCLNPIIYTAMSQKFRRSFKNILRRLWSFCPFVPSGNRQSRYESSMGYTSTIRQSAPDTGKSLSLSSNVSRQNACNSSATDSELRDLTTDEQDLVRTYTFRSPSSGFPIKGKQFSHKNRKN